jgi:hypothetical protein
MLGHDTSLGSSIYINQAHWTTKDNTPDPQKPHRTMSSPNHQHQIYQIPHQPSPQLKAVLDYFDCLKTWDFEKITKLSTPYFTQETLPASLGEPARSKSEDIKNLHTLRDSLKGGPLEVCDHGPFPPRFSELNSVRRLLYTMSMRTRAKFGSTYVPSLISSKVFTQGLSPIDHLTLFVQLMMKGVNLECILLFAFGTGKDENLFTNLTEFFDSKVFTDGSNGNAQPEPGVQPEAHADAASPKP